MGRTVDVRVSLCPRSTDGESFNCKRSHQRSQQTAYGELTTRRGRPKIDRDNPLNLPFLSRSVRGAIHQTLR